MIEIHASLVQERSGRTWRLPTEKSCSRVCALASELSFVVRHGFSIVRARRNKYGGYDIEASDCTGFRYVSTALAIENTPKNTAGLGGYTTTENQKP